MTGLCRDLVVTLYLCPAPASQVDAQPQPEMPRTGEKWEGEDMQLVCHELQTYVSIIERDVETVDRMNSQSHLILSGWLI